MKRELCDYMKTPKLSNKKFDELWAHTLSDINSLFPIEDLTIQYEYRVAQLLLLDLQSYVRLVPYGKKWVKSLTAFSDAELLFGAVATLLCSDARLMTALTTLGNICYYLLYNGYYVRLDSELKDLRKFAQLNTFDETVEKVKFYVTIITVKE